MAYTAPMGNGLKYYNYKKRHSIVLMAIHNMSSFCVILEQMDYTPCAERAQIDRAFI